MLRQQAQHLVGTVAVFKLAHGNDQAAARPMAVTPTPSVPASSERVEPNPVRTPAHLPSRTGKAAAVGETVDTPQTLPTRHSAAARSDAEAEWAAF
jgi:hypothetical protein